jgi:hypothetical protein
MYKSETTYKSLSMQLLRLLGYLQSTKMMKYNIKPSQPIGVMTYIDAAFATHDDSKSHSGIAVFVAGVLVFSSSKKHGCVTKSPTKSELVASTDNFGFIELFEELITFLVNDKMPTPVINQDSSSVVTLVTHGGGVTRTRHLCYCMHLP